MYGDYLSVMDYYDMDDSMVPERDASNAEEQEDRTDETSKLLQSETVAKEADCK